MAKSSALDKLFNDTVRGFGLQSGRTLSKSAIRYMQGKIHNPNTKFRKLRNRFELPGKFSTALSKVITLIAVFQEEYNGVDEPALQRGFYLLGDINYVQSQIQFLTCLAENDVERAQIEKLSQIWSVTKNTINA